MDTTAYLTGQGWLGTGHSLHPTGRGIKKPLLVSRKSNVLGVGKKRHDAHADQWWARAFDAGLKSLQVGQNETTGAIQPVKAGVWGQLDMLKAGSQKWAGNGGLYAGFVRGEGLSGTITPEIIGDKRKRDDGSDSTEIGCKGLIREKRTRAVGKSMDQYSKRQRKMVKKGEKTPVAISEDATRCMGLSTKTALVVMDGYPASKESQFQQQGTTSVEVSGQLADEDTTGIEPTGKTARRKKQRQKDSSAQGRISSEQSTAKAGTVGNEHRSLVNSSLESVLKRQRKGD